MVERRIGNKAIRLVRGDITDLLMSFATPTGTGLNMFIDDLLGTDANNASFNDNNGDARNFAFLAGLTITLNTNLTNDSNAKVMVFFSDAGGNQFATDNAIIVQDDLGADMQDITPLAAPLSFTSIRMDSLSP